MNKAILIGRLTKEPEIRTTTSNIPRCNFTLAIDRRYKNASGERETDYIQVVAWRHTANFVSQYFKKGMRVAVFGYIQTRSWEDNDGNRRYTTEVVAEEVEFADGKKDDYEESSHGQRNSNSKKAKSAYMPEVEPGGFDDGESISADAFEESASNENLPFDF